MTPFKLSTTGKYKFSPDEGFELRCINAMNGDGELLLKTFQQDGVYLERSGYKEFTIFRKGEGSLTRIPGLFTDVGLQLLTTGLEQNAGADGLDLKLRYTYSTPFSEAVTTRLNVKARPREQD
ncbi:MAG: hypothetical protein Q4P08_03495 [Eubacteriales bacterium]|nr:hypothetical protein [Eubacteriales bacterium]